MLKQKQQKLIGDAPALSFRSRKFTRSKLRLEQHKRGRVDSTKNKGPFKLVYFEGCINQQDATHREKYLKKYLGRLFLKNRLKSYLIG